MIYCVIVIGENELPIHGVASYNVDDLHLFRKSLLCKTSLIQLTHNTSACDKSKAFAPLINYLVGIHGELTKSRVGAVEEHDFFKFIFFINP